MFKKFLTIGLFMVAFLNLSTETKAQSVQNAILSVTVVDLTSFILADVAPSLVFTSADDYANGISYTSPIIGGTVTSNSPYSVTVATDSENLSFSGNDIPVSSVAVEPVGTDLGTTSKVNLSTTEQTIMSGAPGGLAKTFQVTYSTAPGDENFLGKPSGIYTVNVIYTVTVD